MVWVYSGAVCTDHIAGLALEFVIKYLIESHTLPAQPILTLSAEGTRMGESVLFKKQKIKVKDNYLAWPVV
jgi:hypothetical protein